MKESFEAGEESMLAVVMPHLEELSMFRKAIKEAEKGGTTKVTVDGVTYIISKTQ